MPRLPDNPGHEQRRNLVIETAVSLVATQVYCDNHPEDPHGGDALDLANDMLDEALRNYANHVGRSD